MKKCTLNLVLCLLTASLFGQITNPDNPSKFYTFELSNTSISVPNSGSLCNSENNELAMFQTNEDGSITSLIKTGKLVIAGITTDNGLRMNLDAESMRPGPLTIPDESSEFIDDWDRFWEMNSEVVQNHIADFNDNNTIDSKNPLIYAWPGNNNPYFEEYNGFPHFQSPYQLAPYWDNNLDAIYNPDDGDYPLIKGDKAIWWIVNTGHEINFETASKGLLTEIQGMAYTYEILNPSISNTLYYSYEITNRDELFNNFYYGHYINFDIDCPLNDYEGIDTTRNLIYFYNNKEPGEGCETSEYGVPLFCLINLDINDSKSCSSSGIVYRADIGELPVELTFPQHSEEFYNLLNSKWKTGSPFTFGGFGYNPGSQDFVNHLFPGNPSDSSNWRMCDLNLINEDARSISSSGPYEFAPDQVLEFNYAIIQADRVNYPCPDITNIQNVADEVINNFNNNLTSTAESKTFNFNIYPNPTNGHIQLEITTDTNIAKANISNLNGRNVIKIDEISESNTIDVSQLNNGIYIITVADRHGNHSSKKIVVMK